MVLDAAWVCSTQATTTTDSENRKFDHLMQILSSSNYHYSFRKIASSTIHANQAPPPAKFIKISRPLLAIPPSHPISDISFITIDLLPPLALMAPSIIIKPLVPSMQMANHRVVHLSGWVLGRFIGSMDHGCD